MRRYLRFSVSVYAAMCPLAAMVSAATEAGASAEVA